MASVSSPTMMIIPAEVLATFKCDYCCKLPTKAPIYQQRRSDAIEDNSKAVTIPFHADAGDNDMIVCADCSMFISQSNHHLVRLTKLECLIPYWNANSSPLGLTSTSPLEAFEPPVYQVTPIPGIPQAAKNDVDVNLVCSLKGNKTTKNSTVLQYTMRTEPAKGKQLCVVEDHELNHHRARSNSLVRLLQPVDIVIDGAIALTKNPTQVYRHVELIRKETPVDETLTKYRRSGFTMPSAHLPPMREQVTMCKNGCLWHGPSADLGEHLKTCTMVRMQCCITDCDWTGSEQLLKGHLFNHHRANIRESIEGDFGWQDEFVVLLESGIIFIFKCFYYEELEYVEMLVQGVGDRTEIDYKYTVDVYTGERDQRVKLITKNAKCMIFNKCVLEAGIQFHKKEFRKDVGNYSYKVNISRNL